GLHKGYDTFQSLLSELETHGAGVSTKDANQKFLRSLPSSWSQVSLIMRTMATTIEQQVVLDEALVPSTQRCPFFKAFMVTADVPEVYMQELSATTYVHQRSIQFKMNNKKHIVDLESFREMLHICPRIPGQAFAELPFEEEILEFIRFLGHDFVYQVEHKNQKKSNEMYYPRFTKVIIHHFMSKDPSIPRRNKINWHYVRDDSIFSTIKVVSRHQNTQQYGAMLPIELTNDEIKNTKAYKEYYACATGEAAPKPKANARRKRSGLDTSITPPTATTAPTTTIDVSPRLTAAAKGKQPAKAKRTSDPSELGGSGTDETTGTKPRVSDVPSDDSEEELSWNSSNDEDIDAQEKDGDDDKGEERGKSDEEEENDVEDKDGDARDDDDDEQEIAKIDEQDDTARGGDDDEESESDEESDSDETREEEIFDPIPRTPEDSEDDGNGEEDQGLRVSEEERLNEEEEADELYRDQESSSVSSQFVTSMLNPTSDAAIITTIRNAPIPPTTIPSEVLQNLPTFDSVFRFEDRLKSLEANFSEYIQTNPFNEAVSNIPGEAPIPPPTIPSIILENLPTFNSAFCFEERLRLLETSFYEYRQTNQFADALSTIPGIVHQYMDQQMKEAVREAVQIQTDRLQDSLQRENDEFLRNIDENMKKVLKELVKNQVKEQVSRILPRIEESMNATLEAEVLTWSSHSSRTSYVMEGNKSIQRSDEQRNLYKALVEAYEADKATILDTYGDEDERMMIRKDPPLDQTEGLKDEENEGSMHQLALHLKQLPGVQADLPQGLNLDNCLPPMRPPSPDHDWNKTLPAAQGDAQSWISVLARQTDAR
nr:hypothetical protein [Tanacetum cinerariifolium]